MKVQIVSDHAGFELKQAICSALENQGHRVIDLGTNSNESCDYPDFAHRLASHFDKDAINIAICFTGQGMAMTLNKYPFIRAAICYDLEFTKLARKHNDANVLVLPAMATNLVKSLDIIETFYNIPFMGGRHLRRINKIPINNG